jgi:signal transduction histidine kinase
VLRGVIDRLALRVRDSGVNLQAEIAADLPGIVGDGDRLSQVFSNDRQCAEAYTARRQGGGGRTIDRRLIGRQARGIDRGVEITVADTGSGIPPEPAAHFRALHQIDKSRARSKKAAWDWAWRL